MQEFALVPRPEVSPASRMSPRCVLLSRLRHAGVAEKSDERASPVASSPIPSSVPRVGFSKRCVSSVVASCKRSLRPVASASGQVAPKSVLQGALSKFRRAAQKNKSMRICERLATLGPATRVPGSVVRAGTAVSVSRSSQYRSVFESSVQRSRRSIAWDRIASPECPAEADLHRLRPLHS